ncbi:MAG TPA: nucleotidyltransferase domain-containing protein [Allosphingosinicella sp.]|jgi:hypothetical protein
MSMLALALFGSKARGDDNDGSDTDLLVWTDEPYPRHLKSGHLSFAFYPEADLLRKASGGDLFAAHLVLEAKPIYDPAGVLDELRRVYRPPASYASAIVAASDLAWFLLEHGRMLDAALVNVRVAWCVRTVAIARSAEAGRMVFSTKALAESVGSQVLPGLIGLKDERQRSDVKLDQLRGFIDRFGSLSPFGSDPASLKEYGGRFERTANAFALKTLRSAGLKDEAGQYF